jgi:hypothetical protein
VAQILDPDSHRPVRGSTVAGGGLDAEVVVAGRSLEVDIGCSPEADCTVDRRTNRMVLTF